MIQKISYRLKNRKGFTLVELMVVVVIIGILAAIAVPLYSNVTSDAQAKADKASARTILSAVSMASAKYSTDTPTEAQINEFLNDPIKVTAAATATVPWAVNKVGSVWKVYKWDASLATPASVEIKPSS